MIGDPYITLAEIKVYLGLDETVTRHDDLLNSAIDSVSRESEQICSRQFNKDDTASVRTFTATYNDTVDVDDFWTADDLVITVAGKEITDYTLYPRNGVVSGQSGWPFYRIGHPGVRKNTDVTVTAKWGWASVPEPVKQACLMVAAQTFMAKDAPFGVAGMDEYGTVRMRDNRMAAAKLARYRRTTVMVG